MAKKKESQQKETRFQGDGREERGRQGRCGNR